MDDSFVGSRYARMRWNTPLGEDHAELLLDRLNLLGCERIVDLGCGWGELLLRALRRAPAARGIGLDSDPAALSRGRELAGQRGLAEMVEFVEADAGAWSGRADRALSIGSSHAFGGTRPALEALASLVSPGGRLLFGDGCWPGAATPAALEVFGAEVLPLADLVAQARSAGWWVIHLSTADQREWDDFESTWRAGRQEWLLANETDPRAEELRDWLNSREDEYLRNYRGVLGFAYLVLARGQY